VGLTDQITGMIRGAKPSTMVGLAVVTSVAYVACLALNLPGHFPPDALWELAQGRSGIYNSWHPPITAWLLGVADRVSPDAGLFMAVDAALFFLAMFAFAAISKRPRVWAIPVLAAVLIQPISLIWQGAVLKDVLFADTAVAGFAALAWSHALGGRRLAQTALTAAAFLLFTLAALSRQTGFVVPLCGAAALAAMIRARGGAPKRAVGAALLALMISALVWGAASCGLAARGDGQPENRHQLQRLQAWDVAGALHLDPDLTLPATHAKAPELETFLRRTAAPMWRSASSDNIAALPAMDALMTPRADPVGQDWLGLILRHPGLYGRVRTAVFVSTLATPASDNCPMMVIGVDGGDPGLLNLAGMKTRTRARDDWDEAYATAALRTPLFSHLTWAAMILICLALGLRDQRRGERAPGFEAIAGLGCAALLYAASYVVISGACDYRYLYVLDVAGMALLVHRVAYRAP